jgi:MFS family permease
MAAPSACSLGSLCALSGTLGELVAARVVQGLGGALLLPVGRLAVLRTFPRERFLQAMSFIAIPGLIGPLIGPTLGGWLVEVASWHWIFLINLPVGVLGAVAAYFYMRNNAPVAVARFDWSGYLCWPSAWWRCRWRWTACRAWAWARRRAGAAGVRPGQPGGLLAACAARAAAAVLAPAVQRGVAGVGLLGNLFARLGSSCMPFLIPCCCRSAWAIRPSGRADDAAGGRGRHGVKRITTPLITRLGYRRVLVGNTVLVGLSMMSLR